MPSEGRRPGQPGTLHSERAKWKWAAATNWTVGEFLILNYLWAKTRASLVAQSVKNPPAMQESRLRSLGQEDPLEKEMATHPSILAWRIPWTEEPGRLQSMRKWESDTTWDLMTKAPPNTIKVPTLGTAKCYLILKTWLSERLSVIIFS